MGNSFFSNRRCPQKEKNIIWKRDSSFARAKRARTSQSTSTSYTKALGNDTPSIQREEGPEEERRGRALEYVLRTEF
jgi:hypothetical protein